MSDVLAWNAGAARTLQRFLLCRERGELEDYLPEVVDHEDAFPSPLVHGSRARARATRGSGATRGGGAARARAHAPRSCRTGTSTSSGSSASACSRRPAWRVGGARARGRPSTTSCCATAGRTRSPSPSWRWTPPAARSASWRPRSSRFEDAERHFRHGDAHERADGGAPVAGAHAVRARPHAAAAATREGDRERAHGAPRPGARRELLSRGASALGTMSATRSTDFLPLAQARAGSNSERLTKRPRPG